MNRYLKGWPACADADYVEVDGMSSEQTIGQECVYVPRGSGSERGGALEAQQEGMMVHFRAIVQPANNSVYEVRTIMSSASASGY